MDIFSIIFNDSPKITKVMTITCVIISLTTWLELFSPLVFYFNYDLIFKQFQVSDFILIFFNFVFIK